MITVGIDRNKSERLFYEIRDLGVFFAQSMGGVVQNPDFASMEDLESFKEICVMFEKRYEKIKKDVESLFS